MAIRASIRLPGNCAWAVSLKLLTPGPIISPAIIRSATAITKNSTMKKTAKILPHFHLMNASVQHIKQASFYHLRCSYYITLRNRERTEDSVFAELIASDAHANHKGRSGNLMIGYSNQRKIGILDVLREKTVQLPEEGASRLEPMEHSPGIPNVIFLLGR
jgi:hypothetical protein